MIYERAIRPALFRIGKRDPETAHHRVLRWMERLSTRPAILGLLRSAYAVSAPRTVFGIDFPNPVGLAAGGDKEGVALPMWAALGFGFMEVGTITRHPQPGGTLPRVHRLPNSEAIINSMGFPNSGAHAVATRLSRAMPPIGAAGQRCPVGISLGKSMITPINEAVEDYVTSLHSLYPHADYFAVNVSSPNTPGLTKLQEPARLKDLLRTLREETDALAVAHGGLRRPMLVKVSPDLTESALAEILEVCAAHAVSGIIATNTTSGRTGLQSADSALGGLGGGLSGRPLSSKARAVVSFVHRETSGTLPIVGVGGVMDADDAERMFDAGASLVQLYTGFIFRGPDLVRRISSRARGAHA